jgi:AcrR family transcriptional regulator
VHDHLPPPLDLLWGTRGRTPKERKQALSVDRIVAAAIELADAGGLEAVSMGRVAKRLGFAPMSLYRHVQSKEELLVLMVNDAVGEPSQREDASSNGWRQGLRRWSEELLDVLAQHPWVVQVPLGGPPTTPSQLAWLEGGLRTMADTQLTEAEKAAVVLLLNGYAFWVTRLSADLGGHAVNTDRAEAPAVADALLSLLDAERFPALRHALKAGIFDDDSIAADLSFGLERILDGVDRLVAERAAST